MKKMLFAALFAAFSTGLFGQKIFLSGGVLNSEVEFKNVPNAVETKTYTGYFAGVRVKIGAPGPLYFAPSAQVSARGYKTSVDTFDTTNRNFHLDLNAMLGAKLSFLSIEGGLFGSTPLTEEFKINGGAWQKPTVSNLSNFDWGLAFGGALTFGKLGVFGRYNIGLSDYFGAEYTDANGNPIADAKAQNRFFQLGLNVRLN